MARSRVIQLHEYRGRRERRYQQARALYSADREHTDLLRQLWDAAEIASADRAAVVWVDEYGPGLVHTHVILDLASEQPRRSFEVRALRSAWGSGVPGIHDTCERTPEGLHRSVFAVALGSDGLRAWFFVLDSQSPRSLLAPELSDRILFLAGEASAIVMHRDMNPSELNVLIPEGGKGRFAAWPVLKDIEGYEKDEVMSRRITSRFLVTRVVRAILDDDLATDQEALEHQVRCVRKEIGNQFEGDPERPHWLAVLDTAERFSRPAFATALLAWGQAVEKLGHLAGAREIYRSAYQAAMATGAEAVALDAARFSGRVWRRGSEWDRAMAWYEVARTLAGAAEDTAKVAVILDGIAKIHKEKGNLAKARKVLDEALPLALESGDRFAIGATYHDMGAVEAMAENSDQAIRLIWLAVQHYNHEQDRMNALTSLAATLLKAGELTAAENAYRIVASHVEGIYRLYALHGLANVAALRGDRPEYERRLAAVDAAGFAKGPAAFRAGSWIGRAEGYQALGDLKEARRCYRRAAPPPRPHKLGQFVFQADEALALLKDLRSLRGPSESELPAGSSAEGIEEIREELGRMQELVPALADV